MLKIGKPKEPLELFDNSGSGTLDYSLDILRVSLNSPALDNVPQACDHGNMKLTFFSFDKQASLDKQDKQVIQKPLQDLTDMEKCAQ